MAESNSPQKKTPIDHIAESESSDEELNQHLCTSQTSQAALAYTMAQCNPTVERGPGRQPKLKPLPKEKAQDKMTQTQGKDKSH